MAISAPDVVQIRVAVRTAIRRPRPCALPRPCISPSAHQVFLPFPIPRLTSRSGSVRGCIGLNFRASSTRSTDGCQVAVRAGDELQPRVYRRRLGLDWQPQVHDGGRLRLHQQHDWCVQPHLGGPTICGLPFYKTMNDIVQVQERCTRTSAPERRLPMLVPAQLSRPSASAPLLPRRIILLASGPTVSYGTDFSQVCTQAPSICSASSPRRPATRRR